MTPEANEFIGRPAVVSAYDEVRAMREAIEAEKTRVNTATRDNIATMNRLLNPLTRRDLKLTGVIVEITEGEEGPNKVCCHPVYSFSDGEKDYLLTACAEDFREARFVNTSPKAGKITVDWFGDNQVKEYSAWDVVNRAARKRTLDTIRERGVVSTYIIVGPDNNPFVPIFGDKEESDYSAIYEKSDLLLSEVLLEGVKNACQLPATS